MREFVQNATKLRRQQSQQGYMTEQSFDIQMIILLFTAKSDILQAIEYLPTLDATTIGVKQNKENAHSPYYVKESSYLHFKDTLQQYTKPEDFHLIATEMADPDKLCYE